MGEQILVVPTFSVDKLNIPEGVTHFDYGRMDSILQELSYHTLIMDRDDMEGNPEYRQLIPYVVLHHEGKYFSAVRTKEGGDARLHGKRIIGFGGHANLFEVPMSQKIDIRSSFIDLNFQLKQNARRELDEELVIEDSINIMFNGFINDLSSPVSRDHLGIYIKADLFSPSVKINETSVLVDESFMLKSELEKEENSLENWSKMLLAVLV